MTGMAADQVLANMRERVARKSATQLVSRLGDGRVLSVSIQPRADGGWVVTLHDITERERLNARLVAQNALLQQREEQLGAQNARFDAAIGNMSQGMCLYDAEQRIVFANCRYAEIYGLTPEQVKPGTTLRQIFEARVAGGQPWLQRPGELRPSGLSRFRNCTSEVLKLDDGRFISVVRRPMPDGGLVSTHEDITEREQLSAKLARRTRGCGARAGLNARNEQLDAALENMLQGLAMFDAEQRLIVCNTRYAEMYGLTPEQVKPGTTVREIFEYRLANGHYHVKDSDGLRRRLGRQFRRGVVAHPGAGRRAHHQRVAPAPWPDGGRVVTHEDITERQKLNAQLGAAERSAQGSRRSSCSQQNLQLDAALNNMVQGLAMFDAEQRLVIANERYAEMYGLDARAGEARHDAAPDRRASHRQGLPAAAQSVDELLHGMLRRMSPEKTRRSTSPSCSDGRYIAVSVQPMADGGRSPPIRTSPSSAGRRPRSRTWRCTTR